jgi:hypothetical protein
MVKVLGVLFITFLIVLKEIPPLKKQKKKKEIWIFSFFQLFATTLFCLIVLDVKVPSPLEVIRVVYKPISEVIFTLFS